jgi:hypothetical protein
MQKRLGFTVDENSDPKVAETALEALRRMVEIGKQAEAALAAVERDGFYDGVAPLASEPTDDRYNNQYAVQGNYETKKKTDVHFVHLPRRLPISRADLGDMARLRIEMGGVKDTSYAGNPTKEVPLYVAGPLAVQTATGAAEYEVVEDRRECGHIRINKSHLSWLAPASYGTGDAHRVYKEMKYAGARESMKAFAVGVSRVLVVKGDKEMLAAAKTLDLQNSAWEWFLEDGHAERMFRDIHEITRVIEVMEA